MIKYQFPDNGIKSLSIILNLSEENFKSFCEFLSNIPIGFTPKSVDKKIAEEVSLPQDELEQILILFFNIHRFKVKHEGEGDDFIEDLYASILNSNQNVSEKIKIKDFKDLKKRISKIISIDKSLSFTQKAMGLFHSSQKIIDELRIITDIRPVLDESTNEFNNYLVLHQLEIEYTEDIEDKVMYFTFDNDNLKKLKELVIRAEKKYNIYKEKLNKSNLNELKLN